MFVTRKEFSSGSIQTRTTSDVMPNIEEELRQEMARSASLNELLMIAVRTIASHNYSRTVRLGDYTFEIDGSEVRLTDCANQKDR